VTEAAADDDASVRAWLRAWGGCVAAVDFERARPLFDAAVTGFGTFAGAVVGLDRLEAEQWRQIWPTITGFAFDVDGAQVLVSGDRCQAVIAASWTSARDDRERPGRATVVLRRADATSPWLGVHTHFSLVPQP
jgi:ketosteroid isomerase-like protein